MVEEPAGSAELASRSGEEGGGEKVGEADAKKKINRDKREVGGVSDQPFLPYGVPAGTTKEKTKKKPQPGRERQWRRVRAAGGGSGRRETGEIYYCLWQPLREPGRGAEARGGGRTGQRTIRST